MKALLFHPFERYSEKTLLSVAAIVAIFGVAVSYFFNVRFDGVLDIHLVAQAPLSIIIDVLINTFSLFIFLFIVSKYINSKTRVIDVFLAIIIARTPLYIVAFLNVNGIIHNTTKELVHLGSTKDISTFSLLLVTLFAICTLLAIVWYIALLYNGFKVASNAKGKKGTLLFIISILCAELLSKFLIIQFN